MAILMVALLAGRALTIAFGGSGPAPADLPASRFAFAAPKGVKVIDMNALMAANDKP